MFTIIYSNGSKWNGQDPDSIDKLIEILSSHIIEESFFTSYRSNPYESEKPAEYANLCPIKKNEEGNTIFFGNFEELSHVFRIETNDQDVINKLSTAIKNNKGWKLYYEKNLVKS